MRENPTLKAVRVEAGGGTEWPALAPRALAIIVIIEEQLSGRSPAGRFCSIHLGGAQDHSHELTSVRAHPFIHV